MAIKRGSRRFDPVRVLLGLVWACLFMTSFPAISADLVPVRLQLKWYHQFQFAGYYAAVAKGYYREEGLDVELIEGRPSQSPDKAVLEGKAEFGVHDGGDLVLQWLEGQPVQAVAAVFQHSPYVVVASRQSGIRVPSDLVGRRLMITQDQGSAQILAMLRREGVKAASHFDKKPVHFLPHTWQVSDLIDGRVDAMTAYLTDFARFRRQFNLDPVAVRPLDYGIDFYGDTLFTHRDIAEKKPELVLAFRRASMKGWQYAMENMGEIADHILSLPSGREQRPDRQALLDEAEAMQGIIVSDLVDIGNMNEGRWNRMASTYRELGMTSNTARSKSMVSIRLRAWAPPGAVVTRKPCRVRYCLSRSRMRSSSSTTSR